MQNCRLEALAWSWAGPTNPRAAPSYRALPFFTTKQDVGTGLGLWICESIIEAHRSSMMRAQLDRSRVQRNGLLNLSFLPVKCEGQVSAESLLRHP